ncbi:hypothetical protein EAI_05532 [Harpegnathos saltator]|uniref:Uncharacterized protein n=1 Tax=Harpegnathos saltator TaxID=610380 RepID=E2BK55_HARSA|nr:hypothetical protein EAI_05532 [Harpegnathos saltator]
MSDERSKVENYDAICLVFHPKPLRTKLNRADAKQGYAGLLPAKTPPGCLPFGSECGVSGELHRHSLPDPGALMEPHAQVPRLFPRGVERRGAPAGVPVGLAFRFN